MGNRKRELARIKQEKLLAILGSKDMNKWIAMEYTNDSYAKYLSYMDSKKNIDI